MQADITLAVPATRAETNCAEDDFVPHALTKAFVDRVRALLDSEQTSPEDRSLAEQLQRIVLTGVHDHLITIFDEDPRDSRPVELGLELWQLLKAPRPAAQEVAR